VINAGSDLLLADLLEIIDIKSPEYLCTIINEMSDPDQFNTYLKALVKGFAKSTLILSGISTQSHPIPDHIAKRVQLISSSEEIIKLLSNI